MNRLKVIQLRQRHSPPGPEAGDRLWAQGDLEGAVHVWVEVLHATPQLLEVRLGLAAALCALGRWDDAARELSVCLPFCPDRADVLAKLAICHLQRNDHPYARMLLEQALNLEPGHRLAQAAWSKLPLLSEVEEQVAILVWEEGQPAELAPAVSLDGLSREALEDMVLLEPGNAEALRLLAHLAEEDGNSGWARRYLERAIEADSLHWESYYHLGRLNASAGDRDLARDLMERAVLLNPRSVEALSLIAQLSNPSEAALWYERAYTLQPSNAAFSASLAALAVESGNLAAAETWIARAHQLEPDNRAYAYNYGLALYRRGDVAKAQGLWQKAQASLALAALAYLDHDLDTSAAHLGREPVASGHLLLGDAYLSERRPSDAAMHFLAAAECNATLVEAWINAGVALREAGLESEADEAWRRAIDLEPSLAQEYFG